MTSETNDIDTKYPFIRAWKEMKVMSHNETLRDTTFAVALDEYEHSEMLQTWTFAHKENPPLDAVWRSYAGRWTCLKDLPKPVQNKVREIAGF